MDIKKVIGSIVIVFAMATLAACNGGGGGSPVNGTPIGNPSNGTPTTPPPAKDDISGCIIGATHSITIITTPGGASATTNATSGCYTIANLPNGDYTVTPSDGSVVFVPKSTKVSLSATVTDVKKINFTNPAPALASGTIVYPCPKAICEKDLSTGSESVAYAMPSNTDAGNIVSMRSTPGTVLYNRWNIPDLMMITLSGASPIPTMVWDESTTTGLTPDCNAYPMLPNMDTVHAGTLGNLMVLPVTCQKPGQNGYINVFMVKMDGTYGYVRVTNDAKESVDSPVFGGFDASTNTLTVLYLNFTGTTTSDIMRTTVTVNQNSNVISKPTVFAKNVSENTAQSVFNSLSVGAHHALSVSQDYKTLAFIRKINGELHIIVKPLAGGKEVDLGIGDRPFWTYNGSGLLLYSVGGIGGTSYVVHKDGTGRKMVTRPSNMSEYNLITAFLSQ